MLYCQSEFLKYFQDQLDLVVRLDQRDPRVPPDFKASEVNEDHKASMVSPELLVSEAMCSDRHLHTTPILTYRYMFMYVCSTDDSDNGQVYIFR